MTEERKQYLQDIEIHGAENGWVTPLTDEDREFFAYFRSMCKRYNIVPSKATRMEYDFVSRVAGRYDSKVYDKLKEAELQARETVERHSHKEVMSRARKRLDEIARKGGSGV